MRTFLEAFSIDNAINDKYQSAITFSFDIQSLSTWNHEICICMLMCFVVEEDALHYVKKKLPRYVKTTEENLQFEIETGVPYTYTIIPMRLKM